MAHLALVRHGKSVWNELGLWTGLTDVELHPDGFEEARAAGEALRHLAFDVCHTSVLQRARQTLDTIKAHLDWHHVPTVAHEALNERHYGDYTGKNKWQVRDEVGEELFLRIRRSWDHPIPNGESLKQVYDRVRPYFEDQILPDIRNDRNVLVVAHGNSLRAIVKHLEDVSDEAISGVELSCGEARVYQFDSKTGRFILQ